MGIVTPRKSLEELKGEWAISGGKVIYDGPWQGGQLRIYQVPSGYTAQYFFSLSSSELHPKWFISVDLERVDDETLVRYLIEGRDVASETVKSVG